MLNVNELLQEFKELQSGKKLLQVQLNDLNELIDAREEELALLRIKANEAAKLKSILDNAIIEIGILQESIDEEKSENYDKLHIADTEKELLAALKLNQQYQQQLDVQKSLQADLRQTEDDLNIAMDYYSKNRQLQQALSLNKSNLELAELEISDLKIIVKRLKIENNIIKKNKEGI